MIPAITQVIAIVVVKLNKSRLFICTNCETIHFKIKFDRFIAHQILF